MTQAGGPGQGKGRGKKKQRETYGKVAKKGAAWSAIRQGGHELMAVPFSMVMARLLTPKEFGVAVAASFFVLLSARLMQFGFGAALVRVKEVREEHTSSVFLVSLGTGLVSYGVLFLCAPAIGRFFQSPQSGELVRVAALSFVLSPFGSVASSMLTRRMEFRAIALADWTDSLVGSVTTIALALAGWSYWSIVYGQVAATGLRVLLQMYLARWRPSLRFSRAALRELLSYGLGVQTKRLLEYAAANLDNLVVGRLMDMASLGFYDKAFSTMGRLVNRLTLGQAPFRIFSIINEDRERFQRAYERLILSVTMLGYPALTVCIVVAGPLFDVLYGRRWAAAVLPFQILCVGGALKLLNNYGSQANEALGGIWRQASRQAIGTVLVVVGAYVGTRAGGIAGAALGVTVATAVLTLSMQALVRRALGLSWRELLRPQVPAVMCSLVLAAVLMLALRGLARVVPHASSLLVLAITLALAAGVFVLFIIGSPYGSLRALVRETAEDLLPGRLALIVGRVVPSPGGGQ